MMNKKKLRQFTLIGCGFFAVFCSRNDASTSSNDSPVKALAGDLTLSSDAYLRELRLRTATQMNATMAGLTGVDLANGSVRQIYAEMRSQLPGSNDIKTFNGPAQVATLKLAGAYCQQLFKSDKLYNDIFGAIVAFPPTKENLSDKNIDLMAKIMIERFWVTDVSLDKEASNGQMMAANLLKELLGNAKNTPNIQNGAEVIVEAESGKLSGNFKKYPIVDGEALGSDEQNVLHAFADTNGGRAEYTFTINDNGSYKIYGLVRPDDYGRNSFYVTANSSDPQIWGMEPLNNNWVWMAINAENGGRQLAFDLRKGGNTLVLKAREDGTLIDKFAVIANNQAKINEFLGTAVVAPAGLTVNKALEASCMAVMGSAQVTFY